MSNNKVYRIKYLTFIKLLTTKFTYYRHYNGGFVVINYNQRATSYSRKIEINIITKYS